MKSRTTYIKKSTFKCSPLFKTTLDKLLEATAYTKDRKQTHFKQGLSFFIDSLLTKNKILVTKLNTGDYVQHGVTRRAGAASNIKQLKILAEGQSVKLNNVQTPVESLLISLTKAVGAVSLHKSKSVKQAVDDQTIQSDEIEQLKEILAIEMDSKDCTKTISFNTSAAAFAAIKADKSPGRGTREVIVNKIVSAPIVKRIMRKNDPFAESLNAIYQDLNDEIKKIHIMKIEDISYSIDLAKLIHRITKELNSLVQNASKN